MLHTVSHGCVEAKPYLQLQYAKWPASDLLRRKVITLSALLVYIQSHL